MTNKQPHPVDVHIGRKLRMTMALRGVTQQKLGDALGVTFQQVQKYLTGQNRIACSKMHDICQKLELPVSYFFDGLETEDEYSKPILSKEATQIAQRVERLSKSKRDALVKIMEAMCDED